MEENRTGRVILVVGASAVLLWLLLRHRGFGRGARTDEGGAAHPCQVFIRANRIDLDGYPADLPAIVQRCRASGHADVRATGDAVVRTIGDVVGALVAAGVTVHAPPDVWSSAQSQRESLR